MLLKHGALSRYGRIQIPLLSCRTCRHHELSLRRHYHFRRRIRNNMVTTSELDPSTVFAITQQGAAFGAVILAEGFYTRTQLPDTAKGRPSVPVLIGGTAGIAAAVALVSNGGNDKAGLILGTAVSLVLLLLYVRRAFDVVGSPQDWPGPKVWPAGMALASFFATGIFTQGLLRA